MREPTTEANNPIEQEFFQQFVQQEVDGLIRQRRITNGRTDALIFLD